MTRYYASLLFLSSSVVLLVGADSAFAQRRTGTVIGELKAMKSIGKKGDYTSIDVLAPGEEKPRTYIAPIYGNKDAAAVLQAVRAAKVGDKVEVEWVDYTEALAIKGFKVLQKGSGEPEKQEKGKNPAEKRSGTIIGQIKAMKNVGREGNYTSIDILAPGEEKARTYLAPIYRTKDAAAVLQAVRAAKVGDLVEIEWIDTGEELSVRAFKVLKQGNP